MPSRTRNTRSWTWNEELTQKMADKMMTEADAQEIKMLLRQMLARLDQIAAATTATARPYR